MSESDGVGLFQRRWLTLAEAAAALETDEEGLLQGFVSGAARYLPVYVHSDKANFSGMCTPQDFARRFYDDAEFRENACDEFGRIAVDHRRAKSEEWERWFQLIGAFRLFPGTLKRIARERALPVCPVAPGSWWSEHSPIPKSASGDPIVRFDVQVYDNVMGERAVSFDRIRIKVKDIQAIRALPERTLRGKIESPRGKWPWGDHDTVALRHLEAAGKRFWINYDPSDPTSADTNEAVAKWLTEERQVSERLAKAIASLLRADGLPSGPRK